jgi:3-oxoadipate enol-lactonase
VKLHRVVDGAGPALLLSGSIGTTTEMWAPVLPLLAGFRTIRVDHPGHGGSPVASASLDEYGRGVLDVLDELAVERTHVCGLSLGGALAIWLATRAPERVDRIVLAGTRAKFGDERQWHERAATVRTQGTAAIVDATLHRWFTPAFGDREPTRRMIESVDDEGYARCCELLASIDLRGDLGRVTQPTLVLRGADDPSADESFTKALLDGIPHARLVTIPHAAHMPVAEQPEAFGAAVRAHLAPTG